MSKQSSIPFGIYANIHEIRLALDPNSQSSHQLESLVVVVGGLEHPCEIEHRPDLEACHVHRFRTKDQPHLFCSHALGLRYRLRDPSKSPRLPIFSHGNDVTEHKLDVHFRQIFKKEISEGTWKTSERDEKRLPFRKEDVRVIVWVKYDFHFFGKELLPKEKRYEISPDIRSSDTLFDILNDVMSSVGRKGGDKFSAVHDFGGVIVKAIKDVHPVATIVVSAFELVFQYLEAQQEHLQKFHFLIRKAHEMLQALSDTHYIVEETEDDSGLLAIISVMQAVVEVADYAKWLKSKFKSRREMMMEEQFHNHANRLSTTFSECENALTQAQAKVDRRRQMIKRIQVDLRVDPISDEYKHVRDGSGKNRVKGTFEDALKDLHSHINQGEPVVWIIGAPGCGKTTLITALRAQLRGKGYLTASYCFPEHGDGSANHVWPVIAYQIALNSRAVREALWNRSDREQGASSLKDLFRELILAPLQDRETERRLVIFIDGIDKALLSRSSGAFDAYIQLLDTFALWHTSRRSGCTLVISSRVLYTIRQVLDHTRCQAVIDLSAAACADAAGKDITRFLREKLGTMRKFSIPPVGLGHKTCWPGQEVLDIMVSYASGSYAWATAARDYVDKGDVDVGLGELLRVYHGRIPAQRGVELYESYYRAIQHVNTTFDQSQLNLLKGLLGALTVFMQPPSFSQLIQLEILPPESTGTTDSRSFDLTSLAKRLGVLLPFVVWDEDGERMRIFHDSFIAILQSRSYKYTLDPREQHGVLVRQLLRWLNRNLHFNMGGIKTSYIRVASPPPPHLDPLFTYAFQHLPKHIRSADVATSVKGVGVEADIFNELNTFFFRHFLHWLEVVSLLGVTASTTTFMNAIHSWVKGRFPDSDLLAFLTDARVFCTTFAIPISFSPAHIYISALPFAPSTSEVSKKYLSSFKNLLAVSQRPSPSHSPPSQELTLAVGFSKTRKRAFSGTSKCYVYQWDLETGAQYSFCQLAKGKTATAMSFSANGQLVAVVLEPNSVYVYDLDKIPHGASGDARAIAKFGGPPDTQVSRVVFFPAKYHSSDKIAYLFSKAATTSGQESTICVVDIQAREGFALDSTVTKQPLEDVIPSPDGNYVVARTSQDALVSFCSGSTTRAFISREMSGTLSIWEVASKSIVTEGDHPFKMLNNPNGHSRKAWKTSHHSSNKAGRTSAFAVGNGERTQFEKSDRDFVAVSSPVAGVPRIAAASKDMNIYVWNSNTGTLMCVLPSLTRHSGDDIVRLAFSRDGTHLVSGFSDGDLAVWDVSDKELLSVAPYAVIPVEFGSRGRQSSSPTPPARAAAKPLRQLYAALNEQSAIALDDLCYADSDGWVRDDDHDRLFWVPPECRHGFWWPRMVSVNETLAHKMTSVDLRKCVHGPQWQECRTDRNA